MNWSIKEVWNESLERPQGSIVSRERVYASEIGGSMIDRYYKMKGTPYTNPPNSRSMRKFMAGDIWEWIVRMVLIRAGVPHRCQDRVEVQLEDYLPITGRIDFVAGGRRPDYEAAKLALDIEEMPDFLKQQAEAVLKFLSNRFPNGFDECNIEIKSVGSMIFEQLLATDVPKNHHMLQAYVYHKFNSLPTYVLYVCRDDVRLLQYDIESVAEYLEKELHKDLKDISHYVRYDIVPEREKLILWNPDTKKFSLNWKVQYSPYLSMLYTYTNEDGKEKPIETPDEYQDFFSPKVSSWNRVVKRVRESKDLTKSNNGYLEEMKQWGFDLLELLKKI